MKKHTYRYIAQNRPSKHSMRSNEETHIKVKLELNMLKSKASGAKLS